MEIKQQLNMKLGIAIGTLETKTIQVVTVYYQFGNK